ncbi:MAG: replication protein C, IncQ-type [Formivibrio sp.]|nr:replication protein C, IncQ-type [Formivibrio sp.]
MNDPALCLCPGLFRNVCPHDQNWRGVETQICYEYSDDLVVEFLCPELLGGFDLSILQSVTSLAHASAKLIDPDADLSGDDIAVHLRDGLIDESVPDPKHDVLVGKLLFAEFPILHLLQVAGLTDNGRNSRRAMESMRRLSKVTIVIRNRHDNDDWQRFQLLSFFVPPGQADRGHRVHVGLNPRLTRFVLREEHHHTRVSLVEARKLGSDLAARVLHQRLCGVINDGKDRDLKMGTLLAYLYPNDKAACDADKLRGDCIASYRRLLKHPERLLQKKVDETISVMDSLQEKLGWEIKLVRQPGPNVQDALWRIVRTKVSRTKVEMLIIQRKKIRHIP